MEYSGKVDNYKWSIKGKWYMILGMYEKKYNNWGIWVEKKGERIGHSTHKVIGSPLEVKEAFVREYLKGNVKASLAEIQEAYNGYMMAQWKKSGIEYYGNVVVSRISPKLYRKVKRSMK